MYSWCTWYDKDPDDKRLGVKVGDIISANDGDVCLAAVTSEILEKIETPQNLFVDIGFAQGWWSSFVSEQSSGASIIGFEPNEVSYREALKTCEKYKNITLHNVAISDCSGTLQFDSNGEQSNSRISRDAATQFVKCNTLDTYIGSSTVKMLKIDTEGHDLVILQAILPYITQIENLVFECSVYWYDTEASSAVQKTFKVIMDLMKHYKFIYGLSRREKPTLYFFENELDIMEFLSASWEYQYQIDILMTNSEFDTIKKVSIQELFDTE